MNRTIKIIGVVLFIFALAALIATFKETWWWFEVHTGTVHESGPYYGFFSGFGSDLGEAAIITGLLGVYRKHNCHSKGCPWIAHHEYEMDGITYKLCRKCIPGLDHKNRPTREHFQSHHAAKKRWP
jgi:hypothetical protein